jgi:hypothetical protein
MPRRNYPVKKGPSKRKFKSPFQKKVKGNQKVRNAQKVEFSGIHFQSKLEVYCYKYAKELGYDIKYESMKTILFEGIKLDGYLYQPGKDKNMFLDTKKLVNTTYSPDFYIEKQNKCGDAILIIIETKGLKTAVYNIKKKVFLKLMNEKWGQSFYFFEPHTQINIRQTFDIIKTL